MGMASKNSNAAVTVAEAEQAALTELGQALASIAAADLGQDAPLSRAGDDFAEVELQLVDLISDGNGEIVFFNDSGARTLGITTDAGVVADGLAAPHVTAGGADVTGYKFMTFDNGLTLYFEESLDVIVQSPGASAG